MKNNGEKVKTKRSKAFIKVAIIIGVLIIPLMYSYFYLGAFWDPYALLDDVPVAVVNLDKGATINDEKRNLGNEICDTLKEDGTLKFDFTDEETASNGVSGDKYYAEILIPEDFSENVSTVSKDTTKVHSTITYVANQKKNYLAAQIIENAMPKIKEAVNGSIDKEITVTLTDKLYEVPDSLEILKDGMSQLFDGSKTLEDGTKTLSTATITLSDGTKQLSSGAKTLTDGLSVLKAGTGELTSKIPSLTSGVAALNDGAKTANDGATTLKNGTSEFDTSLNTYANGVKDASQGSNSAYQGSIDLVNGVDDLIAGVEKMQKEIADGLKETTPKIEQLVKGTSDLKSGINDYVAGVESLTNSYDTAITLLSGIYQTGAINNTPYQTPVAQYLSALNTDENKASYAKLKASGALLNSGIALIDSGVGTIATDVPKSLSDINDGLTQIKAGLTKAKTGATTLSSGMNTLKTGLNTLSSNNNALLSASSQIKDGASSLASGTSQLYSGTSTLASSTTALSDGVTSLDSGAEKLLVGATSLSDGISKVTSGATQIASGSNDLNNGANELKDGIETAKDGVDESLDSTNEQLGALDGLADYSETPVDTKTSYVHPVANYGSAFAPYFMSLSLWVGGLMIFFGIYLDYHRKIKILSKDSDHILLRSFAFMLIGILQAVLLAFIIDIVLGIDVANPAMLYLSCCLVSLSFISIIQFCLVHIGDVGKFLVLLFLILQLSSCAGTFPIETVPKFFKTIYPYMPMTYSVQLFKESISGSMNASATKSAAILSSIFIIFMLATTILSIFNNRKKIKKLMQDSISPANA